VSARPARLPKGAVRGNPSKQVFCAAHHAPKRVYADEARRCVLCDAEFTFGAEEQRFWYETLRFHFDSTAIRCPACRRTRRAEDALRRRIARAREGTRVDDSAAAWLDLVESLVRYRRLTGAGSMSDALAAARRARRLRPTDPAPLFWEGAAHALEGRERRAVDSFRRFLAAPGLGRKALRPLAAEARALLERRVSGSSP
jgi:hypothetical protein